MQDFLTFILGGSVLLQLAAAVFALRLIRVTGWKTAWIMIAAAVVLMAGRRVLTLGQILDDAHVGSLDMATELVALGISVLMLLGIAGIGPVFRSLENMAEMKRENRERERSYRVLLSNLSGMAYRCRNDAAWTMDFVSDGCVKITGYQAADLIDNRNVAFGDIVHPDDQDWLAKKCQANLDQSRPCSNEYRIINASGDIVWVWDQAQGVYSDSGELLAVEGLVSDITDRKRAEAALASAGTEWTQAMDSFEDAVYLVELDDTVTRANRCFYDMTGLTPAEVIGRNIAQVMHPHGESVPCPVCQARHERRDAYISLDKNTPNRFNRPVEIMVKIMRNETGEPQRILMAARDLTRTRKIEAELRQYRSELEKQVAMRTADLEQANQELESFAYSVSHDLRSPLRAIDGFSVALNEDCHAALNQEGRVYLQRIRSAAQRMGDLIDDILQLSRVVRKPMEQSVVNLSGLAQQVSVELQERHQDRSVTCQITPGMQAEADAGLLRIVLTNLLENAWKFTANQPRPVIEVGACAADDGEHCFFVRDNGAGFDGAYKEKLFQPFHRLHTADEFEGTGIGLATVARIVRRHGGRVWADAEIGQGACFYFSLPDHPASDS